MCMHTRATAPCSTQQDNNMVSYILQRSQNDTLQFTFLFTVCVCVCVVQDVVYACKYVIKQIGVSSHVQLYVYLLAP